MKNIDFEQVKFKSLKLKPNDARIVKEFPRRYNH